MDAPLLLVLLLLGPPARGGPSPDPPSTDPSGPSPDPPSTDRPSPGPSPGPPSTDPSGPSPGPPSTDRPGPSPDPPSADRPSPGPSPGPPSTDPPGPSPGPPSTDPPGPGPGPPSTDPPGPSPGPPSTDPPGPGPGPPSTAPPGPEAGPSPRPSAARPSAAPEGQSPPAAGAGCPPACPCDLRRGACDVACCCDADCDPRCDLRPPRAAFARCLPGSTRAKTQVCVEQSLIFRNNTPYPTETVTDSSGQTRLFCVQLNDSKLNYFQQPQEVTESNFPVLLEQYGGPSFVSPSQPMPPPSAFYRVGDPIQTYFVASSVVSTLRQPVGMGASRLCVDSNPAGFLESKSTSCTRTFTNLSSSCTTDPALDAASYYRDFTVLKTPLNMTVTQSMQVKVTPLVQPEAPQMQGSTCHNIVSEVIYNIEFNGTHGIRNVSVQFKVTNISEAWGSSLQQHFTLHFWSRTPSPTLPRSGNPGYITGAPLLALQKGVPRHVTVLKGQGDGICSQSLKHTVLFGMNVRTSCKLSISQGMEDGNCSYLQDQLYQALQEVSSPQGLAITGNADPAQPGDWTDILTKNCSMQAGVCASCCVVPVSLEIQVLWAKVGLLSNPQAQVLGARYSYQCRSLQSFNVSVVPLTTLVTFIDLTEWPEHPRGQPTPYWKLPFDFFFPFKVALSRGVACHGGLPGALVVSLAVWSIVSF